MFDKPALQLITPDLHALPAEMVSRFLRVDARATSLAFWGDVIDAMPSLMFLDTPPPPLRQRFSVRWGYTPDMTAPLSRRIAEGEVVSFAKGGRGQDLCLFGWSEPEPWGVWSDGAVAMLRFGPPADFETFVVELEFMPFVPDTTHPLTLTICPRLDEPRRDVTFTFHSGSLTTITLPLRGLGPVELMLRFSDLSSPRHFGLGDDARLLGVGLHRMTVQRAKGS